MVVAFDEMKGSDGALRPAYGELFRWLAEVPSAADAARVRAYVARLVKAHRAK